VILKRIAGGRSPFRADRAHLHYILFNMGLGTRGSVVIMLLISLLFSVVALAGTLLRIPESWLFLIFTSYFIIHLGFSFSVEYVLRRKLTCDAVNERLPHTSAAIHEGGGSSLQSLPVRRHGLDDTIIPLPMSGPSDQPVNLASSEAELPEQDCVYKLIQRR
jgi:hypothetical protein